MQYHKQNLMIWVRFYHSRLLVIELDKKYDPSF